MENWYIGSYIVEMNILNQALAALRAVIVRLLIERPADRAGIDGMIAALEKSGRAVEKRAASAHQRPANLEVLAHIIGIERWGQRRMKAVLGEPLVRDEYDGYRPNIQDWEALKTAFHAARQETLSLSKSLRMAGIDPSTCASHNQFGDLTLLGWMYYLNMHAKIESLKIN